MPSLKDITRGGHVLDRQDWLLLFIGAPGGPYQTDQIRVMKGMFLVSKEGPGELRDLYHFEPYAYINGLMRSLPLRRILHTAVLALV